MNITQERLNLIRSIQDYCADIHEQAVLRDEQYGKVDGPAWTKTEAEHVASLFNQDLDPWGLFTFMDELTGDSAVGYRTRDGREWFHIMRQMRNTVGSGLLEGLGKYDDLARGRALS